MSLGQSHFRVGTWTRGISQSLFQLQPPSREIHTEYSEQVLAEPELSLYLQKLDIAQSLLGHPFRSQSLAQNSLQVLERNHNHHFGKLRNI